MSREKMKTGILAGGIVCALAICAFGIILLLSKRSEKLPERVAHANGQSPVQEARNAARLGSPDLGSANHSDSKKAQESESGPDSTHRRTNAADSPARKKTIDESPGPKKESPQSPAHTPNTPEKASPKKADSPDLPIWKAEAEFLKELGTETRIGPFRVKPPKRYERITPPQEPTGSAEQYWWASKPRGDGTTGLFAVLIMHKPFPVGQEIPSLKEIHEHILELRSDWLEGWSQGPSEVGQLAGLTFMRTRWSGTQSTLGKVHGFLYHAVLGPDIVEIRSQDVEAHQEKALRIAEAAALTLKRLE
jgi:hypothetical protein